MPNLNSREDTLVEEMGFIAKEKLQEINEVSLITEWKVSAHSINSLQNLMGLPSFTTKTPHNSRLLALIILCLMGDGLIPSKIVDGSPTGSRHMISLDRFHWKRRFNTSDIERRESRIKRTQGRSSFIHGFCYVYFWFCDYLHMALAISIARHICRHWWIAATQVLANSLVLPVACN